MTSMSVSIRGPARLARVLDRAPRWRNHPRVFPRSFSVFFLLSVGSAVGCERTVTSVGAWEPPPPRGGESSGAGAAGSGRGAGAGADGDGGQGGHSGSLDGLYLEAELGELSGGFTVGADASASSGRYLLAPDAAVADGAESPATARYRFTVADDGVYLIWGRIYSPSIYTNRFHVRVDDGARYLWRITVGDVWYWDDFHDDLEYDRPLRFELTAGTHELLIGNVAAGARLDRLYITASGDEPPGNDTPCRPPHSIEIEGVCHDSCGAQATTEQGTTCSCDGRPQAELFEAYDCASGSCCFVPTP